MYLKIGVSCFTEFPSFAYSLQVGKRLLISRTFCDEEGREYVRHEVVKNQAVIDAYIRVKTSPREKDIM